MQTYPGGPMMQPPHTPQQSWWSRHWKWFLPLVIAVPLVCCCGMPVVLFTTVVASMKSNPAYVESVQVVKNHPRVIDELGGPVEVSWWVTGGLNVEGGGSGEINAVYSVTGPSGSGTITLSGTRFDGTWTIDSLVLTTQHGMEDLLDDFDADLDLDIDADADEHP